MRERLLIWALPLLGSLICAGRVEAKTTVSLEGTTITFDVPIVIFIPVEAVPSDPEERRQLRDRLRDTAEMSSNNDEVLALCWGSISGPMYRNCYFIRVNIHASIRFLSDPGARLPGRSDHALEYNPSQRTERVIWNNSADPYSSGLWGTWNHELPIGYPTLGTEALLNVTFQSNAQAMANELGDQAERQLKKKGIELPGCFCICYEVKTRAEYHPGWSETHNTYEISVIPDATGRKLSGSGRGAMIGNGLSHNSSDKGHHEVRSKEKADGTYRRGMINLKMDSEQDGIWWTTAAGGVSRDIGNDVTWTLEAGPLDENGYYYNREVTTKGDTRFETIIRVQRCEQGSQGGCLAE